MSAAEWTPEFDALVRSHLTFLGTAPLRPDSDLAELGLDSMRTVALLLDLEEGLRIVVPDDLLDAGTFATAGSLWAVVGGLLAGRDAAALGR